MREIKELLLGIKKGKKLLDEWENLVNGDKRKFNQLKVKRVELPKFEQSDP